MAGRPPPAFSSFDEDGLQQMDVYGGGGDEERGWEGDQWEGSGVIASLEYPIERREESAPRPVSYMDVDHVVTGPISLMAPPPSALGPSRRQHPRARSHSPAAEELSTAVVPGTFHTEASLEGRPVLYISDDDGEVEEGASTTDVRASTQDDATHRSHHQPPRAAPRAGRSSGGPTSDVTPQQSMTSIPLTKKGNSAKARGRSGRPNRVAALPSSSGHVDAVPAAPREGRQIPATVEETARQPPHSAPPMMYCYTMYSHPYLPTNMRVRATRTERATWLHWGTALCGGCSRGAACQQPGICLAGCLCCFCCAPCMVLQERRRLLHRDLARNYVCCANTMFCCIPSITERPELYFTTVESPQLLEGGTYWSLAHNQSGQLVATPDVPPHAAAFLSKLQEPNQEVVLAGMANRGNGLPQGGCYKHRPASTRTVIANEDEDSCCCCFCCCEGGGDSCCSCSMRCCRWAPYLCLPCEACCCLPCALLANRLLIRQHYGLAPNAMDFFLASIYRCIAPAIDASSSVNDSSTGLCCCCCCCTDAEDAENEGAWNGLEEPGCCSQVGWSCATCCAACCLLPCVGPVLAQHADLMARHGYPYNSKPITPGLVAMK